MICRKTPAVILLILMVFANALSYGEESAREAFDLKYKAMLDFRRDSWVKLANFSLYSKIYHFYLQDVKLAKKLGGSPDLPEKIDELPYLAPPENAKELFIQWGEQRDKMLAEFSNMGRELIEWCKKNHPAGVDKIARLVLKESPRDSIALETLGYVYSDVIGWVKGEDAIQVKAGKLPFGTSWLPREEVIRYRKDWVNAWEVTEDNITIRTNTSPELARKLLRFVAKLKRWYMNYYAPLELKDDGSPLVLNLFSGMESYKAVRDILFSGDAPSPAAYYYEKTEQTYIVAGTGQNGFLFSLNVVAHEQTHQFFHKFLHVHSQDIYDKPGIWINEAMASYSETPLEVGDRLVVTNHLNSMYFIQAREWNKQKKLLPLTDFLLLTGKKKDDKAYKYYFYFEGMSLFTYLLNAEGGKYRSGFFKYLREVINKRGSKRLFENCLKISPEKLEAGFSRWIAEN